MTDPKTFLKAKCFGILEIFLANKKLFYDKTMKTKTSKNNNMSFIVNVYCKNGGGQQKEKIDNF